MIYMFHSQQAVEEKVAPPTIYRKDYAPPPYAVETVHLDFILNEEATVVTSKLSLRPTHNAAAPPPLLLNGRPDVKLVGVKVNGKVHGNELLEHTPKTLSLKARLVSEDVVQKDALIDSGGYRGRWQGARQRAAAARAQDPAAQGALSVGISCH